MTVLHNDSNLHTAGNPELRRPAVSQTGIITVFEHQRLTVRDFAYVTDFEWLLAQEFAVFGIKRKRGQWQLQVGHYIGIVHLPSGMVLEILPKRMAATNTPPQRQSPSQQQSAISRTRLWVQRMLADLIASNDSSPQTLPNSKHLGQFGRHAAPLPINALPLSDWLIQQFLQGLTQHSPTKHYQTQIDNQTSLQGRLVIKEQLQRNLLQPHKFVCERSVLSQEMLANRLIKSALEQLGPLLQTSVRFRRIGAQLSTTWQRVSALHAHELTQLATVYQQAKRQLAMQPLRVAAVQGAQQLLEMAYWLLRQSSVAGANGIAPPVTKQRPSSLRLCLLLDMNQAFEQWASLRIAALFRRVSTRYQPLFQAQRVWLNDEEGRACLSIRPDLLIYQTPPDNDNDNDSSIHTHHKAKTVTNTARCYSHVIDIKWKALANAAAIRPSDAYQLASYAQAYQAPQAWLVYPVQDDTRQPTRLRQLPITEALASKEPDHATLWLIPFNVNTGTINKGSDLLP